MRCGRKREPRDGGFTLVEVMVAVSLILLTSLSMTYAFSSSGLASRETDRELAIQDNMEQLIQVLEDQPYNSLLSWNQTKQKHSDHTIVVACDLVEVGLILVELVVTDDNGRVVARLATYRAGG